LLVVQAAGAVLLKAPLSPFFYACTKRTLTHPWCCGQPSILAGRSSGRSGAPESPAFTLFLCEIALVLRNVVGEICQGN
jgi:hypothetical protein